MGSHGYFNSHSSMNPIFLAHGPAFRSNFRVDAFSIVEVYELMCAVLEIEPQPNNGTIINVRSMLKIPRKKIIRNNMCFLSLKKVLVEFSILICLLFHI